MPPNQPPTPNLDKMLKVQPDSQIIGEFLDDFLLRKYRLCTWDEDQQCFMMERYSIQGILADYYGIDLDEMEAERMRLLEYVRESA